MGIVIFILYFYLCRFFFVVGMMGGLPFYQGVVPEKRLWPRGWTLFEIEAKSKIAKVLFGNGLSKEWTGPYYSVHQIAWGLIAATFFPVSIIVTITTPLSGLYGDYFLVAFSYVILAEATAEALDYHLADASCELYPYTKGLNSIIPPAIRKKRQLIVIACYLVFLLIGAFFLRDFIYGWISAAYPVRPL